MRWKTKTAREIIACLCDNGFCVVVSAGGEDHVFSGCHKIRLISDDDLLRLCCFSYGTHIMDIEHVLSGAAIGKVSLRFFESNANPHWGPSRCDIFRFPAIKSFDIDAGFHKYIDFRITSDSEAFDTFLMSVLEDAAREPDYLALAAKCAA